MFKKAIIMFSLFLAFSNNVMGSIPVIDVPQILKHIAQWEVEAQRWIEQLEQWQKFADGFDISILDQESLNKINTLKSNIEQLKTNYNAFNRKLEQIKVTGIISVQDLEELRNVTVAFKRDFDNQIKVGMALEKKSAEVRQNKQRTLSSIQSKSKSANNPIQTQQVTNDILLLSAQNSIELNESMDRMIALFSTSLADQGRTKEMEKLKNRQDMKPLPANFLNKR